MANHQPLDFKNNVSRALKDTQLIKNIQSAMNTLVLKRKNIFSDDAETEQLRILGNATKNQALSKLPELLERLEKKCNENGIQVHWAETIPEANQLVLDIMRSHDATRLVKGKSMVSEEMELNAYLQKHGIEALETDLGEFIIQLNNETPAHIIVPAIHKNRDQISKIFHEQRDPGPYHRTRHP
jgi:L-lactate dehydrogenase complex protein LldF